MARQCAIVERPRWATVRSSADVASRAALRRCDSILQGNVEGGCATPAHSRCRVLLPPEYAHAQNTYNTLRVLAHAFFPFLGIVKCEKSPNATGEPTLLSFYYIPFVKGMLRSTFYFTYVLVYSYVVMQQRWHMRSEAELEASEDAALALAGAGRALRAHGGHDQDVSSSPTLEAVPTYDNGHTDPLTNMEILLFFWTAGLVMDEVFQYIDCYYGDCDD